MRARSSAILAEDLQDYIRQCDASTPIESSNKDMIQLYNFDSLSLDDSKESSVQDEDDYTDLLSSNMSYKITLNKAAENLLDVKEKRPLIPMKCKRLPKRRRGMITHFPEMIEVGDK